MLLSLENVKKLDSYYSQCSHFEPMSAYTYLAWNYYDFDVHFYERSGFAIILGFSHREKCWYGMRPYSSKTNFLLAIESTKKKLLEKGEKVLKIIMPPDDALYEFSTQTIEEYIRTNYIYSIPLMKSFAGKNLQKKRNNLNYFVKTYPNCEIVKVSPENIDKLISDSERLFNENPEEDTPEYKILKDFRTLYNSDFFSGLAIYNDNLCVGITLAISHSPYYEVFIEKADREIRGLYQYLISKNLIINNISLPFMDRQDDYEKEGLILSKESYKPIWILKRVVVVWNS